MFWNHCFAWEQTQDAVSHAFLTCTRCQLVVSTPDILLLCQSKLHLMGKYVLVSGRKIFCQWEAMRYTCTTGTRVWFFSVGISSLTALLLFSTLGNKVYWVLYLMNVSERHGAFIGDPETTSRNRLLCLNTYLIGEEPRNLDYNLNLKR